VSLRVPQRGDKKTLMETVARNAGEALTQHKLRRAGDLSARSQALEEIADGLGLPMAPLRIECFDVSQIQGTDVSRAWSCSRTASPASRVPAVHRHGRHR
jgi:excinuclease ABC subunit C